MDKCNTNCINTLSFVDKEDLIEDPAQQLLGEILVVLLVNGRNFSGRLTKIHKDELWFESKSLRVWMVKRSLIAKLDPIREKGGT